MEVKEAKLLNGSALAYMGDAIFEKSVRESLLNEGYTKVNELHHLATHYVSAKAQANLVDWLLASDLLTKEEIDIFKRGRNTKNYTKAKNADHATYAKSTGFEALIGYLYLTGNRSRLHELVAECIIHVQNGEANRGTEKK